MKLKGSWALFGAVMLTSAGAKEFNSDHWHDHDHTQQQDSPSLIQTKSADKVDQPLAFAVDVKLVNDNPITTYQHGLNDFNAPTVVGLNSKDNLRPYAITWTADKSTIYALTREDDKSLLTINPEDGVSRRLSKIRGVPSDQMIQGMAIDENNTCWLVATDRQNHDTSSFLYTCDLNTGRVNFVGSQSVAPDIHDIAATCDGELYGVDAAAGVLVKLNKFDGSAAVVGSLGVDPDNYLFELTYDRQNDVLYQYVYNNQLIRTAFGRVSQLTGELTYVSDRYNFGVWVGGVESSCSDRAEGFQLHAGFNGSWYNPETDGQGFLFDVLPISDTFFAAWFTFDDGVSGAENDAFGSSDQRWFTAAGELGDDQVVELTIYNTSGGSFDAATATSSEAMGVMTIQFEDCQRGTIEYSMYDGAQSGLIPIQRIAGDNVAMCEAMNVPTGGR